MNCGRDFAYLGVWTVPACLFENPRGARDWAHLRATDLYSVGSLGPDHDAVMRIGSELRGGGGPVLLVGISAMFEYGVPPPRIVNRQSAEKPTRAPSR